MEGITRAMAAFRRDGVGDTGEQDVRALRRKFANDIPEIPVFRDGGPHVRDKEDVPHERALPDLWDEPELSDEDIETVLFEMVDSGELVCGWIEDRGEFGFWVPEPAQEPVHEAPSGHHRSMAMSRVGLAVRASVLAGLAMVTSPFAMATVAHEVHEAHEAHEAHERPTAEAPDVVPYQVSFRPAVDKPSGRDYANQHHDPAPQTTTVPHHSAPRKAIGARHRKPGPAVTAQKQTLTYVGKHRRNVPSSPAAAVPPLPKLPTVDIGSVGQEVKHSVSKLGVVLPSGSEAIVSSATGILLDGIDTPLAR